MSNRDDVSVFKRVGKMGFHQVKPTPQHFLQSLPLPSQQHRQEPGQINRIHNVDPIMHTMGPAGTGSPQLQQLGHLKVLSENGSPPTETLKVWASSAAARQFHLLPPLIRPHSPSQPGSDPPSPYLDVSTAAAAFNSSQPRSPLGQQRRCSSPLSIQQVPNSPASCSSGRLRSSWGAGQRCTSDGCGSAVEASRAAGGSSSMHLRGWISPPGSVAAAAAAAAAANGRSSPASPAARQPLGTVASSGASPPQQQQRQLSPPGQPSNTSSKYAAASNRTNRRKPGWDDNTNPPSEPSFEEAISTWQQDMQAGAYGPKFLGSWAAVRSGQLNSVTAMDARSRTVCPRAGPPAATADMPTAAFQGSGDEAVQQLEGVVLKYLVGKPHLTLMQLQRGILAISRLDSSFQLAAIGMLLRGGFWLAALQVAYADLGVLAEVLSEMKLVMETYLQWDIQLAAATWYWHKIDRDLFMRTFRGLDIIVQYHKLRRQVYCLQQLQHQRSQQMHTGGMSKGATNGVWAHTAAGAPPWSWSSHEHGQVSHPQLASPEQQMLLSVLNYYLADVNAALAAQHGAAGADAAAEEAHANRRLVSIIEICPEAADVTTAAVAEDCTGVVADGQGDDTAPVHPLARTLQVSSDWRILAGAADDHEPAMQEQVSAVPGPQTGAVASCMNSSSSSSGDGGGGGGGRLLSQQQALRPTAAITKQLGAKRAAAASSAGIVSSKGSHAAVVSAGHDIAGRSSRLGCSLSGSSPTERQQQYNIKAAANTAFSVTSVCGDAITGHISNTDTMLLQSSASAGSKGNSSSTNKQQQLRVNPASGNNWKPAVGSSSSRFGSAAAGTAAACAEGAAAQMQLFSAFDNSVSAAEVLGTLAVQQQQELHQLEQPLAAEQPPQQQLSSLMSDTLHQEDAKDDSGQQQQPLEVGQQQHAEQQVQESRESAAGPEPQQHAPVEQQQQQQLLEQQLAAPQAVERNSRPGDALSAVTQSKPEQTQAGASPVAELQHKQELLTQQQQQQQQQQKPKKKKQVVALPATSTSPGKAAVSDAAESATTLQPEAAPTAVEAVSHTKQPENPSTTGVHGKQQQEAAQLLSNMHTAASPAVPAAILEGTSQPDGAVDEPPVMQQDQAPAHQLPWSLLPITQSEPQAEAVPSAATSRPASAAVTAPGQQQSVVPQAPSSPCSRPQSHQASRSDSRTASRPGSAGVFSGRPAGTGNTAAVSGVLLQSGLRSTSAAAAAAGDVDTAEWHRPGSSGSSRMRPASAAGSSRYSGLQIAAAASGSQPASAGGLSLIRPGSAGTCSVGGGAEAVAASLQRLRETCAQQRRDIERAAQTMMEAAASLPPADGDVALDTDAAITTIGTAAVLRSGSSSSSSRPGFALRPGSSSSRPGSALRPGSSGSLAGRCRSDSPSAASTAAAAASAAADGCRPSSAVKSRSQLPSSSTSSRPQPAGRVLASPDDSTSTATGIAQVDPEFVGSPDGPGVGAGATGADRYMPIIKSMQLHQVPEESSRAVLSLDQSQEQLDTAEAQQQPQLQQQQGKWRRDQPRQEVAAEALQGSVLEARAPTETAAAAALEQAAADVPHDDECAIPAQQQMQDELTVIMQMFQQRLEQTALMAQQLLAQQKAGQAGRRGSSGNSRTAPAANSRPGSASVSSRSCSTAAAAAIAGSSSPVAAALGKSNVSRCEVDSLIMSGSGAVRLTPRALSALAVEEPPSAEEIMEYAVYLGMDPEKDVDLLHIAESALTARCPEGWSVHLDQEGNEFFYNAATQASAYEHPMDQHFRCLYQQAKHQRLQQ